MPAPLDPAKREAIEADVRAGNLSRNRIAKAHGVGTSTVSRIAAALAEQGVPTFDRSSTAAATRAAQVDNAERRARLEAEFLRRAEAELAQCDEPVIVGQFGGRDNTWAEREFDRAPHNVRSTLVSTAQRAAKAAADLALVGAGDPAEQARSSVRDLVAELRAQREAAA